MTDDLKCPLTITTNNLLDVINWLKKGYYVIIHTTNGRFYHKCLENDLGEDKYVTEYINTHRFIYVDISKMPGLNDDGEWEYYIKNEGFNECTCSIKNAASDPSNMLYKNMLRI